MSLQVVGSPFWEQWFLADKAICFFCGKAFDKGECVVHWSGIAGNPITSALELNIPSPEIMLTADTLIKKVGAVSPGFDLFLCRACVPSLCRRLLQDWERDISEANTKPVEEDFSPK